MNIKAIMTESAGAIASSIRVSASLLPPLPLLPLSGTAGYGLIDGIPGE